MAKEANPDMGSVSRKALTTELQGLDLLNRIVATADSTQ
jgi:hypothetical protein